VALPLTELPASGDEQSYLETVVALESIGKREEAAIAYSTALARWPRSVGAHMGLGNSRYAMGDLSEAEEAFRRAIELCPSCGDAFNNLAHVLAEQGQYEEAEEAAREAVRRGGPNEEVYRDTVREIKKKAGERIE
jgi:tetratricopeptide (TPR) repeat protein